MARFVGLALTSLSLLSCARPDSEEPLELQRRLEQLEAEIEEGRRLERRLPALESDLDDLSLRVGTLERALVSNQVEALLRLRQALEASGFTAVELEPLPPGRLEGVEVLRIGVTATAQQSFLAETLEELEAQPLLVVLEDLSVKTGSGGGLARVGFVAQVGLRRLGG